MTDEKESEKLKESSTLGAGNTPENDDDDHHDDVTVAADTEELLRRATALAEVDEVEKIAREEEKKLQERRQQAKGKKAGLEKAASKRLEEIGTKKAQKRPEVAVAVPAPKVVGSDTVSDWAKKNQKLITWGSIGALAAAALLGAFSYNEQQKEQNASTELSRAVLDERARIGEPPKEDDTSTIPTFKTVDERRESALAKYRAVISKYPKTGAAILARLGEGSLLLDKKDVDGALAAFNDVKASPLAKADAEVRGRAIEGIGFANELRAAATPAEAPKHLDAALAAYKELENTVDARGFKELALYHQARCHEAKGDKDKAKELLVDVQKRVGEAGTGHPFPYLEEVATDRLRAIDPSLVHPPARMPGAGGSKLDDAQIQKIIEQMKQKQGGGAP